MGGGGDSAPVVVKDTSQGLKNYNDRANLRSNPQVASILSDYGSGKLSLQDALKSAKSFEYNQADHDAAVAGGNSGANDPVGLHIGGEIAGSAYDKAHANMSEADLMSLIATDPATAGRYDQDRLMNDDATKGLFGNGGMMDQAETDATKQLGNVNSDTSQYQQILDDINSGKGLQLNQDDHKLYGDLSGNIARTFGSQEQSLEQSLADRGLAAAPSGVANQEFSNEYGNKFEQLGQLQDQIAMNRVNQAMQVYQTQLSGLQSKGNLDESTLNSDRGTASSLGQQYQNSLSNMFNRDLTGQNNQMQQLATSAGLTLQQQDASQNALNEQFAQEQATKGPSFGDIVGGLATTAAGAGLGAVTGGMGTGLGAALGGAASGALFGSGGQAASNAATSTVKG